MNKSWEENIRQKLAQHEEPAPELSWAELDKALEARKKQARTVRLWPRRLTTAAACAAAVAGTVTTLWMRQADRPTDRAAALSKPAADQRHELPACLRPGKTAAQTALSAMAVTTLKKSYDNENKKVIQLEDSSTLHQEVLPQDDSQQKQKQEAAQKPAAQTSHEPRIHQYRNLFDDEAVEPGRHHPQTQLSVATYMAGSTGLGPGDDLAQLTTSPNVYRVSPPMVDATPPETRDVKHRQPVHFGLGASYRLSPHWSITAGLSYTYLHSDIHSTRGKNQSHTVQRLHYVGIPLNANYTVWQNRQLHVYVSGGGMVEKMVHGKADTQTSTDGVPTGETSDKVSMSQLQWSVNGAVGVEYVFYRGLGVYAEPGVSYYFSNGSPVETIYDEKPVNFNLNIGLRLNIK